MTLARKVLGNTLSQVIGRFLVALLAIVLVKILTNYLGKAGNGDYTTIYEFLAFFGVFADFGIFTIAVREMSRDTRKEASIFGNAFFLRTLFTGGAMILASIAAFYFPPFEGTIIPQGVLIASITTFFVIMSGTLSAALQMRYQMHYTSLALILGKILTVGLICLIALLLFPEATEQSFLLLIWAGVVGGLLTFALTFAFAKRVFPLSFRFDRETTLFLLKAAFPFAIALALNTFYLRMDVILMRALLPNSVDGVCMEAFCGDIETGVYGPAARIMEILLLTPIFFMNSVLPTLTTKIEKKEPHERLLQHSLHFLLAAGLFFGSLLFLLRAEVVQIISNSDFLSTATQAGTDSALLFLAPMLPLAFLSMVFGFYLIAKGRQAVLIWINLVAVLVNLLTNILFIPQYGFVAAAATSLLSELVMLTLMILVTMRLQPFSPGFAQLFRILAAGVLSFTLGFGLLLFLDPLHFFFKTLVFGTIFTALFVLLFWKMKILTPDILRQLKKGAPEEAGGTSML